MASINVNNIRLWYSENPFIFFLNVNLSKKAIEETCIPTFTLILNPILDSDIFWQLVLYCMEDYDANFTSFVFRLLCPYVWWPHNCMGATETWFPYFELLPWMAANGKVHVTAAVSQGNSPLNPLFIETGWSRWLVWSGMSLYETFADKWWMGTTVDLNRINLMKYFLWRTCGPAVWRFYYYISFQYYDIGILSLLHLTRYGFEHTFRVMKCGAREEWRGQCEKWRSIA